MLCCKRIQSEIYKHCTTKQRLNNLCFSTHLCALVQLFLVFILSAIWCVFVDIYSLLEARKTPNKTSNVTLRLHHDNKHTLLTLASQTGYRIVFPPETDCLKEVQNPCEVDTTSHCSVGGRSHACLQVHDSLYVIVIKDLHLDVDYTCKSQPYFISVKGYSNDFSSTFEDQICNIQLYF